MRPEPRRRKQPDDWMTEGVIVMSNPQRSRERGDTAVDKVARMQAHKWISFNYKVGEWFLFPIFILFKICNTTVKGPLLITLISNQQW